MVVDFENSWAVIYIYTGTGGMSYADYSDSTYVGFFLYKSTFDTKCTVVKTARLIKNVICISNRNNSE